MGVKHFLAMICDPLYLLSHFFIAVIFTMIAGFMQTTPLFVIMGIIWGILFFFIFAKVYVSAKKGQGKHVIIATQVFLNPLCIDDTVFSIITPTPIKDWQSLTLEMKKDVLSDIEEKIVEKEKKKKHGYSEVKTEKIDMQSDSKKEIGFKAVKAGQIEEFNKETYLQIPNVPRDKDRNDMNSREEDLDDRITYVETQVADLKEICELWGERRNKVMEWILDDNTRSLHRCELDDELELDGRKFTQCYFIIRGESFEKAALWEMMEVGFADGITADAWATRAWVGCVGWLDNLPLFDLAVTDVIFIEQMINMQLEKEKWLNIPNSFAALNYALNFELLQQKIQIDQLKEDLKYYEKAFATVRGTAGRNQMRWENSNHVPINGQTLVTGPPPKAPSTAKNWISGIFVLAVVVGAILFAMNGGGIV